MNWAFFIIIAAAIDLNSQLLRYFKRLLNRVYLLSRHEIF